MRFLFIRELIKDATILFAGMFISITVGFVGGFIGNVIFENTFVTIIAFALFLLFGSYLATKLLDKFNF